VNKLAVKAESAASFGEWDEILELTMTDTMIRALLARMNVTQVRDDLEVALQ